MLLSLHIVKVELGHYRTHVMDGREELGTFDTISISAAIREAGDHALAALSGYHVWCVQVCPWHLHAQQYVYRPRGARPAADDAARQFKSCYVHSKRLVEPS